MFKDFWFLIRTLYQKSCFSTQHIYSCQRANNYFFFDMSLYPVAPTSDMVMLKAKMFFAWTQAQNCCVMNFIHISKIIDWPLFSSSIFQNYFRKRNESQVQDVCWLRFLCPQTILKFWNGQDINEKAAERNCLREYFPGTILRRLHLTQKCVQSDGILDEREALVRIWATSNSWLHWSNV